MSAARKSEPRSLSERHRPEPHRGDGRQSAATLATGSGSAGHDETIGFLLTLQRLAGNRAVGTLLRTPTSGEPDAPSMPLQRSNGGTVSGVLDYLNPASWYRWFSGHGQAQQQVAPAPPPPAVAHAPAPPPPAVAHAPAPPPPAVAHAPAAAPIVPAAPAAPPMPAEFLDTPEYRLFLSSKNMVDSHESRAKYLEYRDQGHALVRHGPLTSDEELKKRLEEGTELAPGVWTHTSVSGRFNSYEEYMQTRMAAVAEVKRALDKTLNLLGPELTEAGATGWTNGLRRSVTEKIQHLIPNDKVNFDYLPVKMEGQPQVPVLYKSYQVVLNHNRTVGQGFRGDESRRRPVPHKRIEVYEKETAKPLADIRGTRTSFNAGSPHLNLLDAFAQGAMVESWRAGQHFPTNAGVSHVLGTDFVAPYHDFEEAPWL